MPPTLPYGEHAEQVGDLHLPEGAGPWPVVVLWHGGSFAAAYTRAMLTPLAEELARRGFAAYNATYRRLDAGGGVSQTFDDALAAVDALAGFDAPLDLGERPAGVGLSAGAALALHAAAEDRLSRVVDIAGVSMLAVAAQAEGSDSSVWRLFGAGPDEAAEAYAAVDPVERLPLPVPALVLHGEEDEVVPLGLSEEFARRAGPTCELVAVPEAGHFDLHGLESPAPDALFAFLASERR